MVASSGNEVPIATRVRPITVSDTPAVWNYAAFAGRFGEISAQHAGAQLTLAFRLVLEAQRLHEFQARSRGSDPRADPTEQTVPDPDPLAAQIDLPFQALAFVSTAGLALWLTFAAGLAALITRIVTNGV